MTIIKMGETIDNTPNFTNCVLHLVSSIITKKADEILGFIDKRRGFLYITVEGIKTNWSRLILDGDQNFSGRRYFMKNAHDSFERTLSYIIRLSKKVTILTTATDDAFKVVFNHGVRSEVAEVVPKTTSTCTEIFVEGLLLNTLEAESDLNMYEYFVLRAHLSALALNTYSIPIKISDRLFGDIISWPGKFTGLGSAFAAVTQSGANTILPVYANFNKIKMRAFIGLWLYPNKNLQYVFINNNFVMWKSFYKLFNLIISQSFETCIRRDDHFIFILNVECPDSECMTYHRHITTEIRPKNSKEIISCLCLLEANIKMLLNCVKTENKVHFNPFSVRDSEQNREGVCETACLSLLPTKQRNKGKTCSLTYRNHNLVNLMERTRSLKLHYNHQKKLKLYSWLQLQENTVLNEQFSKDDKIVVLSKIYKVITSILNRCNNTQEKTELLQYLVRVFSSINYKDILEDISASVENLHIDQLTQKINQNSLKEIISEGSKQKFEAIVYPHNDEQKIKTHSTDSYLSLDQRGCSAVVPALTFPNNETGNVNLYQQFNIVSRNIYIPKGTSPIMSKREKLNLLFERTTIPSPSKICDICNENICNPKHSCSFKQHEIDSFNIGTRFVSKVLLFKHVKVIGQIDNKYISCKFVLKNQQELMEKGLVFFDQHGIDERIRLENLLTRFLDDPSKGNLLTQVLQQHWIVLQCNKENLNLIFLFYDYFLKYGFKLKTYSSETLIVTCIPEMLHWIAEYWEIDPSDYYMFLFTTAKDIIKEQLQSIRETGHTTNVLPTIMFKHLCKIACSGAVKFGMSLNLHSCEEMISKLSKCKIPFLCAHGRPTAYIVSNISSHHNYATPPNLSSLKQS